MIWWNLLYLFDATFFGDSYMITYLIKSENQDLLIRQERKNRYRKP